MFIRVLKHSNISYSPLNKGRGGREVNRRRGTWTCLEVVLWGDCSLCCQQSSPLTKHLMNHQGLFDPEETTSLCWSICRRLQKASETTRISWEVLWCIFLYEITLWQVKIDKESKANQCKSVIHCLLGYTYILSKYHVTSQGSAPAKHHMPLLHKTASRKTPYVYSLQSVLSHVCFNKTSQNWVSKEITNFHFTHLSFRPFPFLTQFQAIRAWK